MPSQSIPPKPPGAPLSCELFGWLYLNQCHRIRYEDVTQFCDEVLDIFFAALNTDRTCVVAPAA